MAIKHDKACRTNGGFITFRKSVNCAEINVYRGDKRVSKIVLQLEEIEKLMGLVAISMGEIGYFGGGAREHTERVPRSGSERWRV